MKGGCNMSKVIKEPSIADYDYSEWVKLERQFYKDFENSTKYNKSFNEMISEILEGESYTSFAEKTELSANMLYRLKNVVDISTPTQRSTVMTVCIAYKLDLMLSQALFSSLGVEFSRFNKRDYAYTFLLTHCRDKSVSQCNDILKTLGIEKKYWLGSYARSRRVYK